MLKFTNVRKAYASQQVLDIADVRLKPGVYWLKGSNGSGKSTMMKIIAGMIPFDGSLELLGNDLSMQPTAYRRLVNYAEAEPLYPPFLTGIEMIRFFRDTRHATQEQAEELQAIFDVNHFIKNKIHTYSSGMVKRLSLVLVFIGSPQLILLDEPLVTIDQQVVPVLYDVIMQRAAAGVNFIIASHQLLDHAGLISTELIIREQRLCFL